MPITKGGRSLCETYWGRSFTKLNLSQAYQQIPLNDQSKKCAVINTNKGLLCYTRFLYGISLHKDFLKDNGRLSKGYPRSRGLLG